MCDGLCAVEVEPSPKSQAQLLGLFTDVSVKVTESGVHQYRWAGTGNVTTAQEGAFTVREPFTSAPAPSSPTEALLAAATAQMLRYVSGQAVVALETPQLGRVVYNETNIGQLQQMIDRLTLLVYPESATAIRRRPISFEVGP